MLSAFTASPVHRLLVGVPSYGAPVAFARRQHIRSLSGARSNATLGSLGGAGAQHPDPVSLVFVLPYDAHAVAEDATWADVWRVRLPAGRRARHNYGLEKWLLCDATHTFAHTRTNTHACAPTDSHNYFATSAPAPSPLRHNPRQQHFHMRTTPGATPSSAAPSPSTLPSTSMPSPVNRGGYLQPPCCLYLLPLTARPILVCR